MSNVKSFLKRWPVSYRLLQKIYYSFRRVIETYILGTKIKEWNWQTKHIFKGRSWTKGYIGSVNHPHRQLLVATISSYAPLESVLEIGCNTGSNLQLLAKNSQNKAIKLYGIDINSQAIKEGKIWLDWAGIKNVQLSVGRADELGRFKDKSIDVVFTDATILYIGPDKIKKVIRETRRITRKALIFNEWHWENNSLKRKEYFWYDGNWVYDYKALLRNIVSLESIKISKIPPEIWGGSGWEEFGAIIEVRL